MSLKDCFRRKLNRQKARLSQVLPTRYLSNGKRFSRVFFSHLLDRTDQLPSKVDLRSDLTPVTDQSNLGSSAVSALADAYEYLVRKSSGHDVTISRLFIYYNAKIKANDSKCSMVNVVEGLEEYGACLESTWPYQRSRLHTRPDVLAYEQAEKHQINKTWKINTDLNEMKSCLAQGFPFAFYLNLYPSFYQSMNNGSPSIPRKDERAIGSRAMLAVGYSDRMNVFIVRNSWGENWGDQGYCYIPYEYITDSKFCFDVWTIQKLENSDFGREYWHFDDLVNSADEIVRYREDPSERTSVCWNDYYYRRRNVVEDAWEQCRVNLPRNEDDYFDERHRRDRYDRDHEHYDWHARGHAVHSPYCSRNHSHPFYDQRYQDENTNVAFFYSDDEHSHDNHRQSFL